jgi:hypothetical protein
MWKMGSILGNTVSELPFGNNHASLLDSIKKAIKKEAVSKVKTFEQLLFFISIMVMRGCISFRLLLKS